MIVSKYITMNKTHALLFFLFSLFSAVESKSQEIYKYNFGEGVNFVSENNYKFILGGFIQPFIEYRLIENDSLNQTYSDSRFRMRRIRLKMSGSSVKHKIDYRIQFDLSGMSEVGTASNSFLYDAFLTYKFNKRTKLTFGQRSQRSDNRELTMSSSTLQLVERSRLTSVFASIRDFGFFLQRDVRLKNGSYFRNYLEITTGDGINNFNNDHGGLKYGGRVDFLPFGFFTNKGQFRQADIVRENSLKLVFGINYSFNHGLSSRRGREGGSIIYLDDNNNELLPNYIKFGGDFLMKWRGLSVLGEFQKTSSIIPEDISQRVRNDGSVSSSFLIDDQENISNYINNRLMLGNAFNLQAGYIFKNLISADLRFTHLESDEFSFLNNGTFYNRPNYYTFGVSKYFSRNYGFKIQAAITYVEVLKGSTYNEQTGLDSEPYVVVDFKGNEVLFRLITTISF